ncbi:hypothetical protein [Natronobiforma cellulositropha]|uniref:hypothetical protein n=1 Tax=Natronobiforma cellulositropha TaxID=1679076 RepID=UPI0021D5B54D|nr:hypothetical protein [Natronobiforma cellulositropha]
MEEPERPDPDADASEIQEWMDESFAQSVAEGMESVDNGNVTVEIIDYERDEVVGTIDTDGNLKTESKALRNVSKEYIDEGVPVLVPTTDENDEGETVHADAEVLIEPGADGFVRAFVDELPSPFDCDMSVLDELPTFDMREPSSEDAIDRNGS